MYVFSTPFISLLTLSSFFSLSLTLSLSLAHKPNRHIHRSVPFPTPIPPHIFNGADDNFPDNSEIQGGITSTTIRYDYLVCAVGAEVQTFNIPGVKEHACFMKELADAERMQRVFMDCKYKCDKPRGIPSRSVYG